MLVYSYSINDTIEYLKSVKQIGFAPVEFVISEMNKSTKTFLKQINKNLFPDYDAGII